MCRSSLAVPSLTSGKTVFDKIRQIVTRRSTAQKWAAGGAAGSGAGKKERPPEGQEGERAARSKLGGFGAFQLQLELVRDEGDEF